MITAGPGATMRSTEQPDCRNGGRHPAANRGGICEMSEDAYQSAARARDDTSGWAVGFILFAAIMMIMAGCFQFFDGLVALFNDTFYVTTRNYVFQFDATTWGWIHLILGLVMAFAGWGLLSGRTWARVVGITVALLSALANFLWIPYYPFWALTIITLDIFVIWAIPAHGGELREATR
jgi:hypothetical protein